MSKTRNHYTGEFKVEALQLAETSGKPFAEVEREMGLSHAIVKREIDRGSAPGTSNDPPALRR